MYDIIAESDLSILLISDAAQATNYQHIFESIRPGTSLGLSHGFTKTKSIGESFPQISMWLHVLKAWDRL